MLASYVSKATLEAAAAEVGVRVEVSTLNQAGTRHRVKVYPVPPKEAYTAGGRRRKGEKGDARWQRTSASAFASEDRRVHAVCWHGFRAFFRACYAIEPSAVFRTAAATYRGSEHFERVHPKTQHRNIGSAFRPVTMGEACRCEDTGCAPPTGARVTIMKQADLLRCPHVIIAPEHYRADGSCKCNDPNASEMSEWGYEWNGAQWA